MEDRPAGLLGPPERPGQLTVALERLIASAGKTARLGRATRETGLRRLAVYRPARQLGGDFAGALGGAG